MKLKISSTFLRLHATVYNRTNAFKIGVSQAKRDPSY